MHLLALTVDVSNDLPLISYACFLLFHEPVSDAFNLGTDRVQSIIVILDAVSFLLLNSCFKLIPVSNLMCTDTRTRQD